MTTDTLFRGDSRVYYIDVALNGVPFDLTGMTAWFTAKYAPTDADAAAVIKKGMSGGLTGVSLMTNPLNGTFSRVKVALLPADTASLPAKRVTLCYDVQLKGLLGDIYTITSGELLVLPDVTITTV